MTHKAAYSILVELLKKQGWSVRHVEIATKDCGVFYVDEKTIVIRRSLGWRDRLATIAHEIGHLEQTRVKKWRRFIHFRGKLKNTPKNRLYVEAAEIDASKRGLQQLRKIGITGVKFEELNPRDLPMLREIWYKEYLEPVKRGKRSV